MLYFHEILSKQNNRVQLFQLFNYIWMANAVDLTFCNEQKKMSIIMDHLSYVCEQNIHTFYGTLIRTLHFMVVYYSVLYFS